MVYSLRKKILKNTHTQNLLPIYVNRITAKPALSAKVRKNKTKLRQKKRTSNVTFLFCYQFIISSSSSGWLVGWLAGQSCAGHSSSNNTTKKSFSQLVSSEHTVLYVRTHTNSAYKLYGCMKLCV